MSKNPIFTDAKVQRLVGGMEGRIVSPEIESENNRRRFILQESINTASERNYARDIDDSPFNQLPEKVKRDLAFRDVSAGHPGKIELPDDIGAASQELIGRGAYKLGTGPNHLTITKTPPLPPKPKVSEAVLFRIQNVAKLFLEIGEDNGWFDPNTFTCVRLPFRTILFSYDHEFRRFDARDKPGTIRHVNVGMVQATASNVEAAMFKSQLSESDQKEIWHIIDRRQPDSFIAANIMIDGKETPGVFIVMLDETGHVLTDEVHHQNYIWIRDGYETEGLRKLTEKEGIPEHMTDMFSRHGMLCLTALQFLNCKNVEVVDNPPTRQQRREAERQGTAQPVTYKTLVVHPMGKRRVSAANPDGTVRHGVALHIVRGHFKNFTSGPGLGRAHAHGVFWWEAQVRGNPIHGRVEKDYRVEAE